MPRYPNHVAFNDSGLATVGNIPLIQDALMAVSIRDIIRSQNVDALGEYIRANFDVDTSRSQLITILEHTANVGGPKHDPWSESTWKMWLKGKATSLPSDSRGEELPNRTTSDAATDLLAALDDTPISILTTNDFSFCEIVQIDDLRCDCPEEDWQRLFPSTEAIGPWFKEEFDKVGGAEFLGRAPFASWLYARLVNLGADCVEEEEDLGGYLLHLVAKAAARPVGILSIAAESDRIEIYLEGESLNVVTRMKKQLANALLDDFRSVSKCELEVAAAELGCTNEYGWTGSYFLGESNTIA